MDELIEKAEQMANMLASDIQQIYKAIATRVARDVTSKAAEQYVLDLISKARHLEAALKNLGTK